jgi:hypothetical protein
MPATPANSFSFRCGPTVGVTGKGGTLRQAQCRFGGQSRQTPNPLLGPESPKVWAKACTCPVHAALGAFRNMFLRVCLFFIISYIKIIKQRIAKGSTKSIVCCYHGPNAIVINDWFLMSKT